MRLESFHSLQTAKALFTQAERMCQASSEHLASAGLVILQDSVELFFLACALEKAEENEDLKLDKSSFPELISILRKKGVQIAKSGTLNAMNKQRVVIKHYGQVCAPAAVLTFFEASKIAVNIALKEVFNLNLSGIFSAALLKDCEAKIYLTHAHEAFSSGDYNKALVSVRQAIFTEFESEYYVGGYLDPMISTLGIQILGGHKAPAYARSKEWATQQNNPIDLLVIDNERLRFDLLEMGISVQEYYNVRNSTPVAVKTTKGHWKLGLSDILKPWSPTKESAETCIDLTTSFILKKQNHIGIKKQDILPPGSMYITTTNTDAPARPSADSRLPVKLVIPKNTDAFYISASSDFAETNEFYAKIIPTFQPGIYGEACYVPFTSISRKLVDAPPPPRPQDQTPQIKF